MNNFTPYKKTVQKLLLMTFLYVLLLGLLILSLISCKGTRETQPQYQVNVENELLNVRSWINVNWPQSITSRKTTSSTIYLANLNASIESLKKINAQNPTANNLNQLAKKLNLRYKIIGNLDDAISALSVINKSMHFKKTPMTNYLTLGAVLSGFHRFNEALEVLSHIALNNNSSSEYINLINEIKIAQGQYEILNKNTNTLDEMTKGKHALLKGKFSLASHYFHISELKYNGIDPYVLSWMQLQQGIAFLRYGDLNSANKFFKIAHERFPEYYLVTEHLAESEMLLGNLMKSKALYQKVVRQTKNPEFYVKLAQIEKSLKHHSESQKYFSIAQNKFEEILVTHPLLISDHAISFYLFNHQYKKAMELAEFNLKNRQNVESWITYANTALQTKQFNKFKSAKKHLLDVKGKYKINPIELQLVLQNNI